MRIILYSIRIRIVAAYKTKTRAVIAIAAVLCVLGDCPAQPGPPRIGLPFDAERAHNLQAEWAKAHDLEAHLVNSLGMKLTLIPGGRFEMGPNGSKYRVTLAKPFYLGVTEVTLGHFRKFKAGHRIDGADLEFNENDRPAALLSWNDARAFCAWLSEQADEKRRAAFIISRPRRNGNGPPAPARQRHVISATPTKGRPNTPGSTSLTRRTQSMRAKAEAGGPSQN